MIHAFPPPRSPQSPYPAEKARGGEIILKRPWQRIVFIIGLFGFGLLAIAIAFVR